MASPSSAPNATSQSSSFSYAQAAKSKSTAPATSSANTQPAQINRIPSVEGNNSQDQSVVKDSHAEATREVPQENTEAQPALATSTEPAASDIQQSDRVAEQAPIESTSHNNTAEKPSTSPDDASRDSRAASKARGNQDRERSRKSKDRKGKTEEPVPAKPLKEAPVPAVNFWTQRAQTQPNTPPVPTATRPAGPAAEPIASKEAQPSARSSAAVSPSTEAQSKDFRTNNEDHPNKASKHKPPPVRDTVSWPTPNTVQSRDEEEQQKRKIAEKTDKSETNGASKNTKQEWIAMPFTPSVKWSTPMPDTRRGGRGGARGGSRGGSARGGLHQGRGGFTAGATATVESATEPTTRGRSSSATGAPAAESAKPRRNLSTSQTTTRDSSETAARSRSGPQSAPFIPKAAQLYGANGSKPNGNAVIAPVSTNSAAPVPASEVPQADKTTTTAIAQGAESIVHQTSSMTAPVEENLTSQPRRPNRYNATNANAPGANGDILTGEGYKSSHRSFADRQASRKSDTLRTQDGRDHSTGSFRDRGDRANRGSKRNSMYAGPSISTKQTYAPGNFYSGPQSANASVFPGQYPPSGSFTANGRSYRNGPRSASIPSEQSFSRYPESYANYQSADPFTMYQMYGTPASAPAVDPAGQAFLAGQAVSAQLTYYFSEENLIKDIYLRQHIDSKGFVPLKLIAGFKRVKAISTDLTLIKGICLNHPGLELRATRDGEDRVRTVKDPKRWVLPLADRHPSAQNDGPDESTYTHQDTSNVYPMSPVPLNGEFYPQQQQYTGYAGGAQFQQMSSPPMNGAFNTGRPGQFNRHSVSGGFDGRHSHKPHNRSPGPNGNESSFGEPGDDIQNSEMSTLLVHTQNKSSTHSRSASHSNNNDKSSIEQGTNGSVTHSTVENGVNGSEERESRPKASEDSAERDASRRATELRKKLLSPSHSRSKASRDEGKFYAVKNNDDSVEQHADSNDFAMEPYDEVHERALKQRQHASQGECPDAMIILYRFWAQFLNHRFNKSVYEEFRKLAHEDASYRASDVGMSFLIHFYTTCLKGNSSMRLIVAEHFSDLVRNEDPGRTRPAFHALRGAWRDGATNLRNRHALMQFIDPQLRIELDR